MSSGTTVATPIGKVEAGIPTPPLRVALICDYLEEGWPSMDLFGDMLAQFYASVRAGEVAAKQLCPPFHHRVGILPFFRSKRFSINADRFLNRFLSYPRWLRKQAGGFEMFHLIDHSYGQLALELPQGRTVVTCHDLDTFRCLLDPDREPRPRWFRAMARRTLRGFLSCSQVICPSNATREQLLRHQLFPAHRITVIPPGVDPVFFAEPDPEAADAIENLTGRGRTYLLHVGSIIHRKRIDLLLRIFAEVEREHPDILLLRVGGTFNAEQSQLADDLGLASKIIHAPYLTKKQLAAAYRRAALLLQPSEAEGFGLPLIEAMACGCVVVASDIPALREAGGAQADYCATGDLTAWDAAVSNLLTTRQSAPAQWEVRKTQARNHANRFTWPENARRTLAVYHRLQS